MTRAEHLAWAKQRALEYVDRGELCDAISSVISDLNKSELTQTKAVLASIVAPWRAAALDDVDAVRNWVQAID